jgi:hypothetical protein
MMPQQSMPMAMPQFN